MSDQDVQARLRECRDRAVLMIATSLGTKLYNTLVIDSNSRLYNQLTSLPTATGVAQSFNDGLAYTVERLAHSLLKAERPAETSTKPETP